ncbi:hypothetical protein TNIN_437461, partial [Trichonephila inaurata madagascariensis]
VKRRMALVPVGGPSKRPKNNDANHLETAEKSASSDKTGRSHCYNLRPRSKVDKVVMGLSLNCPSITDNKIETLKLSQPSCYNLRPRQKLSVKVDQKKDHLPKSRRRVQKETHTTNGHHISGSETLESLKNNRMICPLTYLDDARDRSYEIPCFTPIPLNMREKINIPLDSMFF